VRLALLSAILVFIVAGCGDGDTDTTEPSQFPTGSVRSWLDALEIDDTVGALQLTHQESMLLILAAENDMRVAEIAPLLRRGATEDSAASYLHQFTEGLRGRYGESLADVTVDGFTQLDEIYAAVTVTGAGAATVITRRAPGGLWQVDLVATLGPALITQIRDLLEEAGEGEDGDTMRTVYQSGVVPALEAAAINDPEDLGLASQIRAIKGLLGDS